MHDDLPNHSSKALNGDHEIFLKSLIPNEKDEDVLEFAKNILDDEVIDTKSSIDRQGNVQTCYIKTKAEERKEEIEAKVMTAIDEDWFNRRRRRSTPRYITT